MTTGKNGWGKPTPTARKYHYFDGFRSLCGGYGWIGSREELEEGGDIHPENCVSCQRLTLETASPQLSMFANFAQAEVVTV